jgi:hypothetical protein
LKAQLKPRNENDKHKFLFYWRIPPEEGKYYFTLKAPAVIPEFFIQVTKKKKKDGKTKDALEKPAIKKQKRENKEEREENPRVYKRTKGITDSKAEKEMEKMKKAHAKYEKYGFGIWHSDSDDD